MPASRTNKDLSQFFLVSTRSVTTIEFSAPKRLITPHTPLIDTLSINPPIDLNEINMENRLQSPCIATRGNRMAYSIDITINENSSAVSLDFKYLSDEFRIVKICRFQCIGWILDAVSQVEAEVQNGAI